ncbi:MAG: 3-deoxy-8-phosphooctulonate synthase, partial [Parvibaculum sp.]
MPANKIVKVGAIEIANDKPFVLIAGPCQLETRQHAFDMAGAV